jgi:tetraacyldisaccharide 4'-kinase
LAGGYGALVRLRLAAYRRGWARTRRAGAPVVSVGNLTVGGSGKTPFAEYLLRLALRAGLRPVLLSRGYGRRGRARVARVRAAEGTPPDPAALGDEPALLALRNPDVPVYAAARRWQAARLAMILDAPGLFVLDDGFQHLGLARELNVLLVDAERGLGNGRLLPWGPLREPVAALERADVIVITKANLGAAEALRTRLAGPLGATVPIFYCDYVPERLASLDGKSVLPPGSLAGQDVFLLCAIAQPEGFRATVAALGASIAGTIALPDHHPYRAAELPALAERLSTQGGAAARWITTEKDAVKLRGRIPAPERLWVLEMAVAPEPAAETFFFDSLRRLAIQ